MKHFFKQAMLAVLLITFIGACNKYPDGPHFSLRTRKARLVGNWKYESVAVGGVDQTDAAKAADPNFELDIKKDGTYEQKGNFPDAGKWKFGEDYDDVYLNSTSDPNKMEVAMRVTRLMNTSMWFTTTASNGVKTSVHLKQ